MGMCIYKLHVYGNVYMCVGMCTFVWECVYNRRQIKVHVSSSYYDRNTKRSYSSFQPFKRYAAILFQNAHALTTPLC